MEIVMLALSAVFGAVGGLAVARPIARRGAAAQKQYEAELRLANVVQGYRNQLARQHEQALESNAVTHPQGYASVESQKVFAKTVLLDLPHFPERIQGAAHKLLETLVGPSTLQFVEGRLHVSGDQPLVESPKDQTTRLLRERDSPAGLLGLVLRRPLSDTAYEGIYSDAIQALDDLLATVRGDRGYEWRLRQRTARLLDRLIRWLVKPELEPRKGVAR